MMARMIRSTFIAMVIAALLACGGSSGPCPKDQELIDRFNANEAAFATLLKDPDAAAVRAQLGIEFVYGDGVHFVAWRYDFPGPGGVDKGYAHFENGAPAPRELVESIDANTNPGDAEEKSLYRRVKGKWYLFYKANH
jgi:hypothetical protein